MKPLDRWTKKGESEIPLPILRKSGTAKTHRRNDNKPTEGVITDFFDVLKKGMIAH
jgi:translation elongation factor EF-Ts